MPKNVYYAMDQRIFKNYIQHKNDMQEAKTILTAEKIESIKLAAKDFKSGETPKNYSVENGVAKIGINGPLEPKADLCAILFDIEMTTYSDIINSIDLAEKDNSVKEIVFEINSPGGNVVGLTRTAEKVKNATKPTTAIVTDMAASAAYWIGSQADKMIAEHPTAEIGSIGVYCQYISHSVQNKNAGIEVKSFRSKNAPLKNVDPFTPEGAKQVTERITEIETVFFDYIASGRQTSVKNIKENYGKGAILIAREALKVGMIDAIESIENLDTPIQEKNINTKHEDESMSESPTKIEMTQDELASVVSKAADSAVEKALSAQATANEAKLTLENNESKRIAGFNSLLKNFPEQKAMIKTEIDSGNSATADFGMKVSSAEETRLKVAAEASGNEDDVVPPLKTKTDQDENSEASAIANICVKGRV